MPEIDNATLAALAGLNGGLGGVNGSLSSGSTGADLTNFQRTVAANDPWNQALAPVVATKLNTSTWTPNQALAGTLGQATIAAVLRALGQHDEASQMASAVQVLPQLYKDPMSVAVPDGVDSSAFNALRFSAIGRQATTDDLIRRALGERGAMLKADGTADTTIAEDLANGKRQKIDLSTVTPEFKQALQDSGGDVVTARQLLKSRMAAQPTLQGLSNSINVFNQLEDLKNKPHTLTTSWLPDYVEGAVNDVAAKLNPGSNSATYNSAVIPLTDSVLRALTQVGRGSQYNLQKILEDLSEAWGKGPDALAARITNYQNEILGGAKETASNLVNNGYLGADPVLRKIENLSVGAPAQQQDLSAYTPAQIDFMRRKGLIP